MTKEQTKKELTEKIKRLIERIRGIRHPKCSYCGKEVEGITYKGPVEVVNNTYSCGCNKSK
jgi:hypothetical protein